MGIQPQLGSHLNASHAEIMMWLSCSRNCTFVILHWGGLALYMRTVQQQKQGATSIAQSQTSDASSDLILSSKSI